MEQATFSRWRRYGHDRLYITAADGTRLGWHDLLADTSTLEQPDRAVEFRAATGDVDRTVPAACWRYPALPCVCGPVLDRAPGQADTALAREAALGSGGRVDGVVARPLNYTTRVPAVQTVGEVTAMLAAGGASAVGTTYEAGHPTGLNFLLLRLAAPTRSPSRSASTRSSATLVTA